MECGLAVEAVDARLRDESLWSYCLDLLGEYELCTDFIGWIDGFIRCKPLGLNKVRVFLAILLTWLDSSDAGDLRSAPGWREPGDLRDAMSWEEDFCCIRLVGAAERDLVVAAIWRRGVTGIVGAPFWPNGRADERAGVLPRGTRKVFAMAYVENIEFDDDGCFKITFFEDGWCSGLWMEISMTLFSYKIYEINIGEELRS